MTNIFLAAGGGTGNQTATFYTVIGSAPGQANSSEAQVQTTWRVAGTFSNLYVNVAVFSGGGTASMNYRVGGGNGNQTISVPSNTTGEFSDATHTDSVSAGNQVNVQGALASVGFFGITCSGIQFAPTTTTNTVNKLGCNGSLSDTSAATTYYNPPTGGLANSTTQANGQFKAKTAGTLQNLYVYVSANTAAIATVDSQISGSNGNLTASITTGATGVFEDTTHTDSISSGNLINTAINATATTSLTIVNVAVDLLTTNAKTHYISGLSTGTTINRSFTRDGSIVGKLNVSGTDASVSFKTGLAWTGSNLEAYVSTNTVTAASTVYFRVAAANGNQNLSYGSSVTGYLEDSTNTDAITSGNEVNFQVITGGTGTSIIFNNIGILASYPVITTGVATWSAAGSFPAVGVTARRGVATWSGSGAVPFTGKSTAAVPATWSAHGSLAAVGKSTAKSVGTWAGSASFAAVGHALINRVATFSGSASLAAVGHELDKGIVTWSAVGSLAAVGHSLNSQKATWNAGAVLSAAGRAGRQGTATFSAHGALAAVALAAGSGVFIKKRPWKPLKPPLSIQINPSHPLAQGLVGAWLFNEGGGLTAHDISGNNRNGTRVGGVTWQVGNFGSALKFDGSTGQVTQTPYTIPQSAGTLSMWINFGPTPHVNACIFRAVSLSPTLQLFDFSVSSGTLYSGWYNTTDARLITSASDFFANQWQLVTFVWNGSTQKVYVNGVLVNSGTLTTFPWDTSTASDVFGFGGEPSQSFYFGGALDIPLVYNRALSPAEIQQLYFDPFCFMQPTKIFLGGGVAIPKPTAEFNAIGQFSAIGKSLVKSTCTISAHGSLATVGASVYRGVTTLSASATFAAIGAERDRSVASWSGHGALVAIGKSTARAAGTWSAQSSFAAVGTEKDKGIANFTATGSLAAVGRSVIIGTAAWNPAVTSNIHGSIVHSGTANFNASSSCIFYGGKRPIGVLLQPRSRNTTLSPGGKNVILTPAYRGSQ